MRKIRKKVDGFNESEEELDFLLWKAELDKELSLFWKLMTE